MIKGAGRTADGEPLVFLGLTDENWRRLRLGQPIITELAEVNLPPTKIVIIAGEDEAEIIQILQRAGLMDDAAANALRTTGTALGHSTKDSKVEGVRE